MGRTDTIGGMFFENARVYGAGRVCQKERRREGWHDYTWADVETIVREMAQGLLALGVEEGARVGIMAATAPQWTWTDLATASVRGVLVTIYPTNTAAQMAYILKDSGASVAVLWSQAELDKFREVSASLPEVKHIVVLRPGDGLETEGLQARVLTLSELRELGRSDQYTVELERRLDVTEPGDLLTLIYTSGTTGNPKGVMLEHGNMLSNVWGTRQLGVVLDTDLALSFLPLSHSLERMAMYTYIRSGVAVAYAEDVSRLVQNLGEIRPTVMVAVPRIYEKMYARIVDSIEAGSPAKKKVFDWALGVGRQVSALKIAKQPLPVGLKLKYKLAYKLVFAKISERLGGRLRFFISGGAPLSKELGEFFHAAGVLICEGYGLTETSPVLTANTPDAVRFGTVGKPLPNVEIRIAPDGEILGRGPNVMRGYYNMPEATAEVLDAEGWFYTGDIGEIDADGFLRITDRKKDIIVTAGGKNVAPQNIENLLKMEKYVEQACVIGDRRRYLSVLVVPSFEALEEWASQNGVSAEDKAALVARPEVRQLVQKAIDNVNAHLARYESIKRFELLGEEFTVDNGMLTPTLKVKRKEVMKTFDALIEGMYAE